MNKYKEEFEFLKKIVEAELEKSIEIKYPEEIYNSMRYSLLAGGKRLRPVMVLEVCKMLSGDYTKALPLACAIEMLHTQSLIHDDLPCMDNDDYRRGKLTNHKMFSESTAVLAGDALLTYAPKFMIDKLSKDIEPSILIELIKEFCIGAGVDGIISGQIVDIDSENKQISSETLDYIHEFKTAKLFILAIKMGALIANADKKQIDALIDYATFLGHAFQIYDDILDEISTLEELGKTPGKDASEHKATYTSIFGLDNAKIKVKELCRNCCDILDSNNMKSNILKGIVKDIEERVC